MYHISTNQPWASFLQFLIAAARCFLAVSTSLGLVVTLQVADSSGHQNAGSSQSSLRRNFDKAWLFHSNQVKI